MADRMCKERGAKMYVPKNEFLVDNAAMIAWTGIALILSAGLFVFWRETVLNKTVAMKRPMPRNR